MIIRQTDRKHYTCISNEMLNDDRLSYEARGMMAHLLSKSDDWDVIMTYLASQGKCSILRVRRILGELQKYGYITSEDTQDKNGRVWKKEITVYEKSIITKQE